MCSFQQSTADHGSAGEGAVAPAAAPNALIQPESSARAANTPLAGPSAAPAAETRHGPHQARHRGPQLRHGLEFGHGLGQASRAGTLSSPAPFAGTKTSPLPARHAGHRRRGYAWHLSAPPSSSPSSCPRPRLAKLRRPPRHQRAAPGCGHRPAVRQRSAPGTHVERAGPRWASGEPGGSCCAA